MFGEAGNEREVRRKMEVIADGPEKYHMRWRYTLFTGMVIVLHFAVIFLTWNFYLCQ